MRKLLRRLGCPFHKVSGFLFKADQDKQKEFVAQYEQDKPKVEAEGWRRYFLDGVRPLVVTSQGFRYPGASWAASITPLSLSKTSL
jgi:hypothetical protein